MLSVVYLDRSKNTVYCLLNAETTWKSLRSIKTCDFGLALMTRMPEQELDSLSDIKNNQKWRLFLTQGLSGHRASGGEGRGSPRGGKQILWALGSPDIESGQIFRAGFREGKPGRAPQTPRGEGTRLRVRDTKQLRFSGLSVGWENAIPSSPRICQNVQKVLHLRWALNSTSPEQTPWRKEMKHRRDERDSSVCSHRAEINSACPPSYSPPKIHRARGNVDRAPCLKWGIRFLLRAWLCPHITIIEAIHPNFILKIKEIKIWEERSDLVNPYYQIQDVLKSWRSWGKAVLEKQMMHRSVEKNRAQKSIQLYVNNLFLTKLQP